MSGPLRDLKIVVLAGMGPVPFASMLLADLGADVVRITRPPKRAARTLAQASALGPEHDLVNRGVRSVAVDLKSPEGVDQVLALAEVADALVEGFRPGVVERLGLGPDVLHARNPTLVVARLTGYGQDGPLSQAAGHDINYVAQTGLLHALGSDDAAPMPPINLLGDYAGGGAMAALGILAAVLDARSSGRGQVVDAAMVDGVAVLTAKIQGLRAAGLYRDEPGSNYLDGAAPFYATYECADGRHLAVGALEDDFYAEFVARLGVDVSDWPAQNDESQWPRLRELIAAALRTRTMAQWAEVYEGTDACVTPVLSFAEAATHPHNRERDLFVTVDGALHPAPAPRFGRSGTRTPATPTGVEVDGPGAVLADWTS
ncbi:CoA transferase [Aeromicrobium senzhongii]|uniref:CoA transferase n=1 Tax=Aeromicrobium senzhongii TaxID=2663859 RepID=A0ABX6ST60_9ACTN|nr:CaiB/BaiF CoA-transferase family protein [Aeromicrobium senzhongii]MTB88957.1 CoA transferase [Aeromicrobium senzhongii]QNL93762.1 CoA transferase [Aeromicrobium senzhongii]